MPEQVRPGNLDRQAPGPEPAQLDGGTAGIGERGPEVATAGEPWLCVGVEHPVAVRVPVPDGRVARSDRGRRKAAQAEDVPARKRDPRDAVPGEPLPVPD